MAYSESACGCRTSPSSRRAWIEIVLCGRSAPGRYVALLAEGVDRNLSIWAVRASLSTSPSSRRAWIEITSALPSPQKAGESPSSRRAWIEISRNATTIADLYVALLAEGVDRNLFGRFKQRREKPSPSSRRAWIEISVTSVVPEISESPSSRRAWIEISQKHATDARRRRRPPRGGRG